jgi:diguanylate cyclase (GGDEF)-like protein
MDPARHGPHGRVADAGAFHGGAPTAGAPVSPPVPAARGVRAWPVWTLSWWLIGFIAVIVIADGAAIALTASRSLTGPGALTGLGAFGGLRDLALFGLLMACEVGGVELSRRAGEKTGISRDMHAVWELPVAILLPLAYAPLSPVIRIGLTQWRVRHGSLHRRVFSAAALGLSYLAASFVFHGLAGTVNGLTQSPFRHGFAWMLIAAVAGVVQRAVNSVLVLTAVKGSDRAVRLRDAQFGREPLYNDMAELCLAVLVSFGVASSSIAVVFSFPFASLPLRTVRHAQLVSDSRTDSKTGLLNAGAWQRDAAAAVGRAVRAGQPLAVAVLDLDWFKLINDTYGHLFGDEVLRQIGLCLPGALRDCDLAGRFGGEEFVLLLPSTRAADAHRVAERVRCRIAGLPLRAPNGDSVTVTASVGVAALAEGSRHELTDLLAAADAALYQAKRNGRNHVRMLSPARGLTGPTELAGDLDGPRDIDAPRALPRDVVPGQPGSPEAVMQRGLPQPGDLMPGRTGHAAPP